MGILDEIKKKRNEIIGRLEAKERQKQEINNEIMNREENLRRIIEDDDPKMDEPSIVRIQKDETMSYPLRLIITPRIAELAKLGIYRQELDYIGTNMRGCLDAYLKTIKSHRKHRNFTSLNSEVSGIRTCEILKEDDLIGTEIEAYATLKAREETVRESQDKGINNMGYVLINFRYSDQPVKINLSLREAIRIGEEENFIPEKINENEKVEEPKSKITFSTIKDAIRESEKGER